MKNSRKKLEGYTLVEMMIVVAIIGILATMATPGFVRARANSRTSICLNNLRILDTAKTQFAIESRSQTGDPVNGSDLDPFLKSTYGEIVEPSGFAYLVGNVGEPPACTLGGTHVFP